MDAHANNEIRKQEGKSVKNWYVLANVGLGFTIACSSFHRYTSVRHLPSDTPESVLGSLVAIIILAIVLMLLRNKDLRLYKNIPFLALMTLVCVLKTVLLVAPVDSILEQSTLTIISEVLRIAETGVFIAYAEFSIRLGAGNHTKSMGIALVVAGTVEFVTSFITANAAWVLLVFVAAAGPVFLGIAAQSQMSLSPEVEETKEATFLHNVIDVSKKPYLPWALWIMLFLVVGLFGNIHTSWIGQQDAAFNSQLIQVTAGTSTILLGNLIFLSRHILEDPLTVDFCKNLILPFTVTALLLSYMVGGALVASYIILLNFAQRFTLFLIWFSPLMYNTGTLPMRFFFQSLIAYYLGKAFRGLLVLLFPDPTFQAIYLATTCVIILIVGAASFVGMRRLMGQAPAQSEPKEAGRGRFNDACAQLIEEKGLTKREGEVFTLLAKGRSADAIAEKLVISPATAQTHVKNIYHKLGINSRQTLMSMVDERVEQISS